jgi:hypothetical protein
MFRRRPPPFRQFLLAVPHFSRADVFLLSVGHFRGPLLFYVYRTFTLIGFPQPAHQGFLRPIFHDWGSREEKNNIVQ